MSVLFVVDVTSIRKKDMEKRRRRRKGSMMMNKSTREKKLDIIWYQMKKR
jgi:hypothetical protein